MKATGRKRLIPLHSVNFFFFSGVACLAPYLSTHMRDLGVTLHESTIVHLTASIFTLILPPLLGLAAERRSRYKLCLAGTLVASGLTYTSLLFVPRVLRLPRQPLMDFDCSPAVNLEKCANWATCSDAASSWSESTFRLSHCRYQCPSGFGQNASYPLHVCFHSSESNNNLCLVYDPDGQESSTVEFQSRLSLWHFTEYRNVSVAEFLAMDPRTAPLTLDVCSFKPTASLIVNQKIHDRIFCRPVLNKCSLKCLLSVRIKKPNIRSPPCYEIVGQPSLTFWLYMGLRTLADMALVSALCLLDVVSVCSINEDYSGAYGRTRVWPALALSLCPPITGALVDYYSDIAGKPDYSPAVFIFAGFTLITCALVVALPLQAGHTARYTVSPTANRKEENKLWTWDLYILLGVTILLGALWGFSNSFVHWFYLDLGFSNLMLGVTDAVTFICSIPFLIISKNLIHNLGSINLLAAAFAFHAIRYAGLSFVSDPWWALPFEAMESFTLSVMWVALVAHGHGLVAKEYHIVIQHMLNLAHFCAGRFVGSTIGGFLTEIVGFSLVFRGMSVAALVFGLLLLGVHFLWLQPRHRSKMVQRRNSRHLSMNGSWHQLAERRPINGSGITPQLMGDNDEERESITEK